MADAYSDGKKPSKDDMADIHRQAMKEFGLCEDNDRDNRKEALDDQKFRAGEQWDDRAKKERSNDGRPCLTINRMPQFIRQVTGDLRQNKPAIKVRPVEDADVGLAEVYTGLIRHIEQQSDADTAYITAADQSATSGMGNFRVNVEYCDDESFNQEIRVKRILNPFAVWWDPLAQEIDRSDARYCFVVDRISKESFQQRYPKAKLGSFDGDTQTAGESVDGVGWFGSDTVRIAEYWVRKAHKKKLGLYADGQTLDLDSEEAKARPDKPVKERESNGHKICQYIISGSEVLEGPNEWAGQYIPIVPVIGEEVPIGDKIVRHGLVRFAKDPQRAFNFMRSASVEAIALQPKAPFALTKDQIKGYETFWDSAGKKNFPYLLYNPDARVPGAPERVQPAVSATGMMQEAALAADDMKAVTGIYDAALGAKSNETSGRAINARKLEGDTGTYVYIDNLSKAIARCGKILVDLIPKIYDTERIIRTLGEDGSEAAYILNKVMRDQQGQEIRVAEPLEGQPSHKPILMKDDAKYDVVVTTGPSYATKRVEAADSMIQLVQAVPQVGAIAGDLIVKAMDLPGNEEIAKRLKKMLPPGMTDPDPNEPPPPPPPPSPEEVKMQMEQQKFQLAQQAQQADVELKHATAQMDMQAEQQKLELERQKAELELAIMREKGQLEIQIMREKAHAQLEIEAVKAQASIEAAKVKSENDVEVSRFKAENDADIKRQQAKREPAPAGE